MKVNRVSIDQQEGKLGWIKAGAALPPHFVIIIVTAFLPPDFPFPIVRDLSPFSSVQRATGWSDWCRHIEMSTEAWLKTNGIGLDRCFINTEKPWHYVIAAVPVVISDFCYSSWENLCSCLSACNLTSLHRDTPGHLQWALGACPDSETRLCTHIKVTHGCRAETQSYIWNV